MLEEALQWLLLFVSPAQFEASAAAGEKGEERSGKFLVVTLPEEAGWQIQFSSSRRQGLMNGSAELAKR